MMCNIYIYSVLKMFNPEEFKQRLLGIYQLQGIYIPESLEQTVLVA